MKLTQSPSQIEMKSGAIGQVVFGVIFLLAGGTLTVAYFMSSLKDDAPLWVAFMGIAFALVGVFTALVAKSTTTRVVKNGNLTIRQKRVLFGTASEQSTPASRIKEVRLVTGRDHSSGSTNDGSRTSQLTILLDDNTLVSIAKKSQSSSSVNGINLGAFRKAPLTDEAKKLAEFLDINLEISDTSSLAGAIKSIKSAFTETKDSSSNNQIDN